MRRMLPAGLAALTLITLLPLSAQEITRRRGFEVTITAPENQTVVMGKTKIVAKVRIDFTDLIDRVEFLVEDEVIFVDREPPWECTHDFGESARSSIIRVVAHHKENVSVSDAVITRKPIFTVVERVDRVVLWLSVTDKQGNLLTDLKQGSFAVFENDRRQEILDFYKEDRPITLAILIDSSGSMLGQLKEVRSAASAFVDTLRDEDRALVIDFDDNVFLIEDLTGDRDRLKEAISSVEAIGGTALYDVVHAAYRKIGEIKGRKAMILLSDGEDTSSQSGFDRVREEAMSNNTLIYAIGLGSEGGNSRKNVLRELADATGGRSFFVKRAGELAEVYRRIAEELRTQYYIAYSTTNEDWDGRFIEIRVEYGLPDTDVRARRGYFAVRRSMLGG